MKTWTLAGRLNTGEAVYRSTDGRLAVEKDYSYLVDASAEEKAEIHKTMSHVRPVSGEKT